LFPLAITFRHNYEELLNIRQCPGLVDELLCSDIRNGTNKIHVLSISDRQFLVVVSIRRLWKIVIGRTRKLTSCPPLVHIQNRSESSNSTSTGHFIPVYTNTNYPKPKLLEVALRRRERPAGDTSKRESPTVFITSPANTRFISDCRDV
jgi:hypothetical protein